MTSTTLVGRFAALPTLGSSTRPVVISGAVTMKMISNTSITSMNGTMFISAIARRPLRPLETTAAMAAYLAGAGAWAALRCRMLENSSMKLSSWVAMRSMSRANRL